MLPDGTEKHKLHATAEPPNNSLKPDAGDVGWLIIPSGYVSPARLSSTALGLDKT